jgi:hypothetical protein
VRFDRDALEHIPITSAQKKHLIQLAVDFAVLLSTGDHIVRQPANPFPLPPNGCNA